MEIVCHKNWGVGIVVKRENLVNGNYVEVSEGGRYITVLFDDGIVKQFAIPSSFKTGSLTAEGEFGEEVMAAIAEHEARLAERLAENTPVVTIEGHHGHRAVRPLVEVALTGDLLADYRTALAAAGYRPSVVYVYGREVVHIAEEEGFTMKELLKNISSILPLYEAGGIKQERGAYQNGTTVNALRRYQEFGNVNPDARK